MQDMYPCPAKILHKPEKLKVTLRKCRSRMKRPVAEHGSKTQENWRRTSKLFAFKRPFGR